MKRAIAIAVLLVACQRSKPEEAEKSAAEFSRNVPGATGAQCAQTDTDGDGYCACTVFRGEQEPFRIDCGCERFCIWNCTRGCKVVQGYKFSGGGQR